MTKGIQNANGASHGSPHTGTRFIRQKQLLQSFVPFSAATLWRLVNAGKFPRPVRLASKVIAWRIVDLEAWAKEPQVFGKTKKVVSTFQQKLDVVQATTQENLARGRNNDQS